MADNLKMSNCRGSETIEKTNKNFIVMENIQNKHGNGMQHSPENKISHSKHSLTMYRRLAVMALAMFCVMYFVMYAMIDSWPNLILNINNLYMALLMTAAMLLIELWVMKGMYSDTKINWIIIILTVIIGFFSWLGIRKQVDVGDVQFVKSMIPHHAAAILMSEKAHLTDPELIKLQKNILTTQAKEIELMKRKLEEFERTGKSK